MAGCRQRHRRAGDGEEALPRSSAAMLQLRAAPAQHRVLGAADLAHCILVHWQLPGRMAASQHLIAARPFSSAPPPPASPSLPTPRLVLHGLDVLEEKGPAFHRLAGLVGQLQRLDKYVVRLNEVEPGRLRRAAHKSMSFYQNSFCVFFGEPPSPIRKSACLEGSRPQITMQGAGWFGQCSRTPQKPSPLVPPAPPCSARRPTLMREGSTLAASRNWCTALGRSETG